MSDRGYAAIGLVNIQTLLNQAAIALSPTDKALSRELFAAAEDMTKVAERDQRIATLESRIAELQTRTLPPGILRITLEAGGFRSAKEATFQLIEQSNLSVPACLADTAWQEIEQAMLEAAPEPLQ